MPDILPSIPGPTYIVTCASRQIMAEISVNLTFNGEVFLWSCRLATDSRSQLR